MLTLNTHCMLIVLLCFGADGFAQTSRPITDRILARSFPSIFQAWNPATNLKGESILATAARHDLIFDGPAFFSLQWQNEPEGLATGLTAESLTRGQERRRELLKLNPNLLLLCEIRYRDAHQSYLPADHPWWLRNKEGKRIVGWAEGNYYNLDFHNPDYRQAVVARAAAVVASKTVDGVMLDWWVEDDSRVALAKELRTAIGDEALILVNTNDRIAPRSAKYINGFFMECYRSRTDADWQRISTSLSWAEQHLREPRINCLESWFHESREDLSLMRATTTLSLTHSDGYALFSDPNDLPTPDHSHNWYPFWEAPLGKPITTKTINDDGSISRRFDNGIAIYNPLGNKTVIVELKAEHRSVATGKSATRHKIAAPDGDILIRVAP